MSARNIPMDFYQGSKSTESRSGGIPVTRDLKLGYVLSLLTSFIMTASSIGGVLYQRAIYPADELLQSFVPNDIFNLVVGLPILLGSMWLARRGVLIGLLSWPAGLFYVLYISIPYVIGVPFGVFFLPHLTLVALSAFTLVGILASIDGEAVRQKLAGLIPARISAGILICLALLIIVRQTALIVTTITGQVPADTLEIASWIADFAVAIPALLVVGVQLWRGKALGYAAGAGLLLGYGVLALSVIPFFVIQARHTDSPIDTAGVAAILFMAALCFAPFVFFVRAAASNRSSSST